MDLGLDGAAARADLVLSPGAPVGPQSDGQHPGQQRRLVAGVYCARALRWLEVPANRALSLHAPLLQVKPYTAWMQNRRAGDLSKKYPLYNEGIVRDFAESDMFEK